jgi:glutathione S-transferase
MKLYYSKGACSLAVRIVIHELGLPCQYEAVDLKTKVTETGANFLSINPKGAVPVLVLDDNTVLTENAVIQQYLADTYHGDKLLPPLGNNKRYQTLQWTNFITTDIHKGFGPIFNPKVPAEVNRDIFIPLLKSKFAIANQALEKNTFLMGDEFTLPDAYLFVTLRWAHGMKIDLSESPNLARYFEELSKRKSIVEAMTEESLIRG